MANVLVCVELRDARLTSPSLFAVGEARRVAEAIGATVYALVVADKPERGGPRLDDLPEPLGAAGADKILLVEDPVAAGCPVFPLWRPLFEQIVEPLRPRLVMFPAGSLGLQLGPPLAATIAAAFIPRASLEVLAPETTPAGPQLPAVLLAHRWAPTLEGQLAIDLNATPAPAVLTLTAGKPVSRVARPAELQGVSIKPAPAPAVSVLASDEDPEGAADIADTVVLLPPGRAQLVKDLGASAPAGTVVSDGRRPDWLRVAAPRLALLLAAKPLPPALSTLRLGPDGHLAVAGTRRTNLPNPLFDRVWLVKRTDAPGALQAAFAANGSRTPGNGAARARSPR